MKKYITVIIIILSSINYANSQCFMDRHNTTWFHSWASCETADNPNSSRGKTHWILYDFGHVYKLEDVHFWNINDPQTLNNGLKDAKIDYSLDGNTWSEFGDVAFDRATGISIYEGEEAFSFNGIKARYILITAIDNWGGDCFGFSEIKIDVSPITSTEMVNFDLNCNDKDGYREIEWTLINESKSVSFEIEKSKNGNDWHKIYSTGIIANKNGNQKYNYNESNSDDAYFRVKIIDSNGNYTYSEPKFCSKSSLILTAYPNPFVFNFGINILAQNDEPIIYSLNDIYGRKIVEGIITSNSKISHLDFDNLNLASGNYFFIARQGSKTGQIKMVKINRP